MLTRLLSITDVAKEAGVARHKICYAITTGRIREPRRLQNRRCFTARDLERIKQYFSRNGEAK